MQQKNWNSLCEKDFHVVSRIGRGSFGDVQLIRRIKDQKLLAMKSVRMDRLTPSERDAALNQIRLLASIKSPYVVSYEGSYYSPGNSSLCMLMEYCEEGDLEKMIKRRLFSKPYSSYSSTMLGIDEGIVWKTVINILNGLKILHSNGIAHRDLKSENIFYHQGEAKIGDLNVSSISSSNAYYKTKTGTPYYTAPEIWKGDIYTSNCDIWSLGCIAYEMCALEPPFKAHSFPELYIKILRGEYEPLDEMYSNQLRTLIRLCLCVQPKERLSAQQLLQSKLVRQKIVFLGCPYESSGEIKLVKEIKCPKALKLLNNHLPTAPEPTSSCSSIEQAKSKKTVQFQIKHSPIKYKNGSTKQCVRSEKHINLNDTEEVSKLQQKSGVHLRSMKKLPPIERQPLFKVQNKKGKQIRFRSQKKISEKENPS